MQKIIVTPRIGYSVLMTLGLLAGLATGLSVGCGSGDVACTLQNADTSVCPASATGTAMLFCCPEGTTANDVPLNNCNETVYSSCYCCDRP